MILDKLSLEGKGAIVTVADAGLGKPMCLALARAGADIIAAAHRAELIEQTALVPLIPDSLCSCLTPAMNPVSHTSTAKTRTPSLR